MQILNAYYEANQRPGQFSLIKDCPLTELQRVPALRGFWDLEKNVLHEIRVSGTVLQSPTTAKIPHLHVHKPKTMVVETVLVVFVHVGDSLYSNCFWAAL